MAFGAGSVASAGSSASYETGVVYGEAGQFGCYATACMGYETNVSIANFAMLSIATSYEAFKGFSVTTSGGADTPLAQVGFQTSQVWRTEAPADVVRRPESVVKQRPIGTASGFTFGVGLSPVSVGTALCYTVVLDESDPLSSFSDIESILTNWADAGFAPSARPTRLPGPLPMSRPASSNATSQTGASASASTSSSSPSLNTYPALPASRKPPPSTLRSKKGDISTEVVFVNESGYPVDIFWVDYDGREVSYGRLEAGQRRAQQTFASHPWIVRGPRNGEPVGWLIARKKKKILRIRPASAEAPAKRSGYPALPASRKPPPSTLRSKKGDVATEVVFVNRSDYPVEIFWVDYEGREVSYGRLEPRSRRTQQTYVSHPWIVRGPPSNQPVGWLIAKQKRKVLKIRPPKN